MKRVLVTGGCGFIGSHMAELLYQNGFEVKVIDNLSTGKIANLENRGISFHYGDIVSEELDKVFAEFKPHYVVHQAAQVSVAHSVTNFHHDANVNIQGTINIINACKSMEPKKSFLLHQRPCTEIRTSLQFRLLIQRVQLHRTDCQNLRLKNISSLPSSCMILTTSFFATATCTVRGKTHRVKAA